MGNVGEVVPHVGIAMKCPACGEEWKILLFMVGWAYSI